MIPNGATFGGEYHTYNDLRMIPKSKIMIAPAQPKLYTLKIPGRDGEIDLTSAVHKRIAHENRKGTIDFLVLTGASYVQSYNACLGLFNGVKMTMVLDDDPGTTYRGRFYINKWKSSPFISQISIDYNIDTVTTA